MPDKKEILFVEDESALQKAVSDLLKSEGFKVYSALNGEVGLRLAESKKPDLIILDLVLPKKDGFEVLKDLKGSEETKSIPVVVLTNLEEVENVQKALSLGATTYLVKSNYTLEEVLEKVNQVLKQ